MDNIAAYVPNKGIPLVGRRPGVAAINRHASGTCEVTGGAASPSIGPGTAPATRSRVRTILHGSTGLIRWTSACGPSAAMAIRGLGAAR